MNRRLRNIILNYQGKLILEKGKNAKIKNSLLEGYIRLGEEVVVENSILKGNIFLESNVENCQLKGHIKIGKYCALAEELIFQEVYHSISRPCMQMLFNKRLTGTELPLVSKGRIEVGHDVWIGTRAIVLSGVKVGNGAVIGAGSVVTKNVIPYEIVAGNPAKHIGYRFPSNIIKELEEKKWWDWGYERLEKEKEWFKEDLL